MRVMAFATGPPPASLALSLREYRQDDEASRMSGTVPMRTLTIADLVAETGVPRATIHSYLRLGLLPRPKRLSPARFAYDERHVRGCG